MAIDAGREEIDRLLKRMQRRIIKIYRVASEKAEKKARGFFVKFENMDKKMRQLVADGKLEELDYKKWRRDAILESKAWARMRDQLAEDYRNADKIARQMVVEDMPEAYAMAHNFATYEVENLARVDTSYTLYNREAVEALIRDDPQLLPPPSKPLKAGVKQWHRHQVQSVTLQSILQGESIDKAARRITKTLGAKNTADAVRYARTAINAAEASGRQAAYERAVGMGINVRKKWYAVYDGRTRHEHRLLDGQERAVDEPFEIDGIRLMCPGDFDLGAPGWMIWNCRCTISPVIQGLEDLAGALRSNAAHGMTYDEWKVAKPVPKEKGRDRGKG